MNHDNDVGAAFQGIPVTGLLVASITAVPRVLDHAQAHLPSHRNRTIVAAVIDQDNFVDRANRHVGQRRRQGALGVVCAHDDRHLRVLVQDRELVGRVRALNRTKRRLRVPITVDQAEGPVLDVVAAREPLVREREDERAGGPHSLGRSQLPGERRRLLLQPLATRVHAEFGEHERPVTGQRVQAVQVPAQIGLAVQVDVEGDEVGEVGGLEIFG